MYETEVKRCYCCERELELNSHHPCWESLNWLEKQIQELWPSPLVSLGICSHAHILPPPTKMLHPPSYALHMSDQVVCSWTHFFIYTVLVPL